MKRTARQKRGQFVIIAVLLIAIMIISIATLMHGAITYYKNEPWDEYMTLMGNIELSSHRILELSLSNYTHTLNQGILGTNLEEWQNDLHRTYVGREVAINYALASGTIYNFSYGLTRDWDKPTSFSAANSTFLVNITSIGLTGYKFTTVAFLNLTILYVNATTNAITAAVMGENNVVVDNLNIDSFSVQGCSVTSAGLIYDPKYEFVYRIECSTTLPAQVTLTAWDQRGISARAKY